MSSILLPSKIFLFVVIKLIFEKYVYRFSDTSLENLISEVLSALLICLTDLENHEKELRTYMASKSNAILENQSIDRRPANYAEILYRIEHRMARYIGPEEFAQCSNNILQKQVNHLLFFS